MEEPRRTAVQAVATIGEDPDRAYRLRSDEDVPHGIRRIARGQLNDAHDALFGATQGKLGEAVHDARKRFKRLRATVRLARDTIGEDTYQRENTSYRVAGGRLAARRDAQVLLETLDALTERFADELPARVTAALRARLEADREHAATSAGPDDPEIGAVVTALEVALTRTPAWTFERGDLHALAPGLRRIYRRGRKRMRAARKDPSPENLHEWRKRVKDLWHASQIVRPAHPKRLTRLSKRAHELADLLGDGHDLSVLRDYVEAHPGCFEDKASKRALLDVIDRRSDKLRDKALKRGRKLYNRKPKRFLKAIKLKVA